MADVISMKKRERDEDVDLAYIRQQAREYARLCRYRRVLERSILAHHRDLDEIDKLLSAHPLLEPAMDLKIKSRAFDILRHEYDDASAERKREILLSLREQYRALPEHYQLEPSNPRCPLRQQWEKWLDRFEEDFPKRMQ